MITAIGSEVPGDVDVGVDHAGQDCGLLKVVGGRALRRADFLDLPVLNDDRGVVLDSTFSIEKGSDA